MFRAEDRRSGESIVILDEHWGTRIAELRVLDRQDFVVCPSCKQPVRVRNPVGRRRHFAHKHLAGCTHGDVSPAVLAARAELYLWLQSKFPGQVMLEHQPDGVALPRPIDCWVARPDQPIAYWVIDAALRPAARDVLTQAFGELAARVHWVFVHELLRVHDDPRTIFLSTTERDFVQPSAYDEGLPDASPRGEGSLHYLDAANSRLTTYRGLHCTHPPQGYRGERIEHLLAEVLVTQHGEFVHPGEHDRVTTWRKAQQEAERQQQEREAEWRCQQQEAAHERMERTTAARAALSEMVRLPMVQMPAVASAPHRPAGGSLGQLPHDAAPQCEICGTRTHDYWYVNKAANTCRCRACSRQGKW